MLKRIDRYILRRYVGAFLFTISSFSMIAAAIDASEKLTKFIKNDLSLLEGVVERYYINFFPYINGAPLATLCIDLRDFFHLTIGL